MPSIWNALQRLENHHEGWQLTQQPPQHAVQDEPEDMLEWMAHHQRLGVGRFYIFDNGSDPPLNTTVADHIASGLIRCEASVCRP